MLTKHLARLRWDQLYNRLFLNICVEALNGKRIDIKGMTIGRWKITGSVQESGLQSIKPLLFHFHGARAPHVDDMDKSTCKWIAEPEDARVQI